MKPGGFRASDLNLKCQGIAHLWGLLLSRLDRDASASSILDIDRAAAFMASFFENIPRERYIFFVETEEEQAESRRSPLEGSYPYGRTGKTARDPLKAFWHFKYSKRGKPDARLIKPGKYTPYLLSEDGDISTPYTEEGSKLRRQPSGKYRHIASYSLDELIALGWDGAMYVSTRARHAANGHYVPFIVGYDSDADDEYEPIDVRAGRRAGTIGLPNNEVGLYMEVPEMSGGVQIVQIQNK